MISTDEIPTEIDGWKVEGRPGFFGRKRDQIVETFNARYGKTNWKLAWYWPLPRSPEWIGRSHEPSTGLAPGTWFANIGPGIYEFSDACKLFYEASYIRYLRARPDEVDFICSFGECIDNAPSNVESGLDYTHQEAYSTHIQDIAVRNALKVLGREFQGPKDKILVIRSKDSEGYRFGPGNIPFMVPEAIIRPERCPTWSNEGSVESFWQSNKLLLTR